MGGVGVSLDLLLVFRMEGEKDMEARSHVAWRGQTVTDT